MPRIVWLVTLLLALLAQLAESSTAAACPTPGAGYHVDDAPANGLVVVTISCSSGPPCFSGEVPDVLPVVDSLTGETIPGELLRVVDDVFSTNVLWLPDAPLVVGRSYELGWRPEASVLPFNSEDPVFEALPEANHDAAQVDFVSELVQTTVPLDAFRCAAVRVDSCSVSSWVTPAYRRWPSLIVVADPGALDQGVAEAFELRAAFWSGDAAPPALGPAVWPAYNGEHGAFDAAAERYCYRAELRSLVDGSTALHEGCLPHRDIEQVGTFAATSDELAQELQWCREPPAGYEAEWCAGTRVRCAAVGADGWTADGCDGLARHCAAIEPQSPAEPPTQPRVDPPVPSMPAVPAPSATDDGSPVGTGGGAPRSDEPSSSRRDEDLKMVEYGCSAAVRAPHAACDALALLGALVFLQLRRRRSG